MNIPSAVLPTSIQDQLFLEVHGRSCQNSALDVWVVHVRPSRGSRLSRVAQRHGSRSDRGRYRGRQKTEPEQECYKPYLPMQILAESNTAPCSIHADPIRNQTKSIQNLTETNPNPCRTYAEHLRNPTKPYAESNRNPAKPWRIYQIHIMIPAIDSQKIL